MNQHLLTRFIFRETLGLVFMGVALFWPAGTIGWWPAWALLALTAAWSAATTFVILRHSPDLLAERLGPRRGGERWDTALMGFNGLLQLAMYIVAGLDQRYGWWPLGSAATQVAALLVCVAGYALVVWATASNAFFSQIVRIQTERGHTVVSGGPYRWVRHPAYAGGILTQVAAPVLLGSGWALLLGLLDAALFGLRTALEDRTLHTNLDGYAQYAARVRYRLLPGVW